MRRVVITGMGVIAAPGSTVDAFFRQLIEGRPGTRPIRNLPPEVVSRLNCRIAAEVPDYDPLKHFTEKELDQLDRFSQFALGAARQAPASASAPPTAAWRRSTPNTSPSTPRTPLDCRRWLSPA